VSQEIIREHLLADGNLSIMKWFHVITLMFSLQVGKVLLLSRCHAAKHVFITPKVLKQKRMYEGQRERLYQQQFNLENAAFTTQAIQDSVVQVQAMQAAGTELKVNTGVIFFIWIAICKCGAFVVLELRASLASWVILFPQKAFKAKELDINAIEKLQDEMSDLMV
jgi:hypothetical protein